MPLSYDAANSMGRAYFNGVQKVHSASLPFRFTGQKLDPETGLYYYKAHYYSPDLGRFLQTDPIGYEDQINLYAYVGNDPLNATDPSGTDTVNCSVSGDTLDCVHRVDPDTDIINIDEIGVSIDGAGTGDKTDEELGLYIADYLNWLDYLPDVEIISVASYKMTQGEADVVYAVVGGVAAGRLAYVTRTAINIYRVNKARTNTDRGAATTAQGGGRKAAERAFQRQTGQSPSGTVSTGTNSAGQRIILRRAGSDYPQGRYIVKTRTAGGKFVSKVVYVS